MQSKPKFRLPNPQSVVFQQILAEVGAKEWQIVPNQPRRRARTGFCDENVEHQVRDKGGSLCWGWDLVEHPVGAIESEAHCVWRTPDDRLVDVTPSEYGFTKIMFLVTDSNWQRPLPSGKGWPTSWDEVARFQADIITVRQTVRQLLEKQGLAVPGQIVTLDMKDVESAIEQASLQTGRNLTVGLMMAVRQMFITGPNVISRSYE